MKALVLWLCLIAGVALAQPLDYSTGGNLKRRQYQTYSALSLFVDPTGSDTNACTSSGTGACLTFAGAKAKLPHFLRHNVTISIAVGAYAEPLNVDEFDIARNITLAVTGTTTPFTVATGTNSGTLTSSTAGTATSPTTVTDSGQTWTVNNLRNAFVFFASTGQAWPIISNTATTLVIPNTASVANIAYTIVTMGSVFTSTSSFAYSAITGAGTLAFSLVKMSKTSALWGNATSGGIIPTVTCTSCDIRMTGSSGVLATFTGGVVTLTRSQFISSATTNAALSVTTGATVSVTNCYVQSVGGSAVTASSPGPTTLSQSVYQAAPSVAVVQTSTTTAVATAYITCTGGAGAGLNSNSAGNAVGRLALSGTISVTGCAIGTSADSGGRVDFAGITPTYTTVTNELQTDGTSFTFATLTGLAAPQVIHDAYGSILIR